MSAFVLPLPKRPKFPGIASAVFGNGNHWTEDSCVTANHDHDVMHGMFGLTIMSWFPLTLDQ